MLKNLNTRKRWPRRALAVLTPLLLTASVQAEELHITVPSSQPEETIWAVPETPPVPEAEENVQPPAFPEAEDWQLLLVNPWNPLPEKFGETLELKSLPNGLRVDRRAYEDLMDMLSACQSEGLRPLVCSAYRTQSVQTRLHSNKIARLMAAGYPAEDAAEEAARWVAVPGTSEHQTGLAVDIVAASYQVLDAEQEKTPEQVWLMEHCWEYGFILRYPSEKSGVTGIGYEPWHYRYVGRAAAQDLQNSGLCLEEYLELRAQILTPQTESAAGESEAGQETPA